MVFSSGGVRICPEVLTISSPDEEMDNYTSPGSRRKAVEPVQRCLSMPHS